MSVTYCKWCDGSGCAICWPHPAPKISPELLGVIDHTRREIREAFRLDLPRSIRTADEEFE